MRKLVTILIVLLFFAGCANCFPSGPEGTVSPGAETTEPTPAPMPTVEPEVSETPNGDVGREHITTPVLIEGFLAGGLIRGEWKYYDAFYKSKAVDFDGFLYDVYVDDAYVGEAAGGLPLDYLTGEPMMPEDDLSGLADVKLKNANQENVPYQIALQGGWNLYPRGYVNQSTDQAEYQTAVENLMVKEGLTAPVTALKQVIEADLDGDGTNEVLFTADNMESEQFGDTQQGDNALLVLRRMAGGQAVDQIVASNIMVRDPLTDFPYRDSYTVESCADLDGDGILEVVVKRRQYEGTIYSIYKLEGDGLLRVASNGAGV